MIVVGVMAASWTMVLIVALQPMSRSAAGVDRGAVVDVAAPGAAGVPYRPARLLGRGGPGCFRGNVIFMVVVGCSRSFRAARRACSTTEPASGGRYPLKESPAEVEVGDQQQELAGSGGQVPGQLADAGLQVLDRHRRRVLTRARGCCSARIKSDKSAGPQRFAASIAQDDRRHRLPH
jgi:hypothetical protein